MNELLWFLMLFLDFGALLLLYRYLGKTGVFIWIPIATILANIQVLKIVQLFGFTATLGNIAYASLFLATDILSENHSRKDAHLAVLVGFLTMLLTILIMTLALAFQPAPSDFVQPSLKVIFGFLPRVLAASLCAYLVSQFYDVASYHFLKKRKPGTRWLWLRNTRLSMALPVYTAMIWRVILPRCCRPIRSWWRKIAYLSEYHYRPGSILQNRLTSLCGSRSSMSSRPIRWSMAR